VLSGKFDLTTAAAKSLQEQTVKDVFKEASMAARDGKLAEAEQPLDRLLADANVTPAQTTQVLSFRGNLRAQSGRFPDAAADLSRLVESDPSDHWNWYLLTPLLIQSGKIAEYQTHCKAMLDRFAKSTNPMIGERVAKSCLLLPSAVGPDDLTLAANLADVALTQGKGSPWFHWFQFTKGLAEYRQGHFADAVEGMRLAQDELAHSRDSAQDMCNADTCFVSAMAHFQLHQADEAQAALTSGLKIVRNKLPKLDGGDLGQAWYDVLPAYILMRQASDMVEGKPSARQP